MEKEATAKQQVLDEASKTEQAKLDAARAPDAPLNDGEAATQVIGDGQDPGGQAADDDLEDLTTHEEIWRHYAKQQLPFFCNLVVWSETMTAGDLVDLLKADAPATCEPADALRGNTMILCDMNVWGAVGSRTTIRKSALTPEHLNTLVSAVLQCRSVDFEASVTYLPIGDILVFVDGGINRASVFRKALGLVANAPRAKDGRTMFRNATAVKHDRSLMDRVQRVKDHAQIKQTEGVMTAFNGKTKIQRRDRLRSDTTNLGDYYGRFDVPPLTDIASMKRGDWEDFWDWRLKPGGGRAPGSESELDDSDDGQEPSKQSSRECKTISPWENKQGRNMMGVRL